MMNVSKLSPKDCVVLLNAVGLNSSQIARTSGLSLWVINRARCATGTVDYRTADTLRNMVKKYEDELHSLANLIRGE